MKKIISIIIIMMPFILFADSDIKDYSTNYTNEAPNIDGNLTDLCWDNVEWATDFIQFEPNSGLQPSGQTAFKILYDNDNIYVAIRCYDPEPDLIDQRLSRRDGFEGDNVAISIDSYYDKRTAFFFSVSAGGVKSDIVFSNDGNSEDETWDPIWFVETNIDAQGWTAEMKIPLSQLRFSANSQVWGLNVMRTFYRADELSMWQPISTDASGWISQFGTLSGLKNLQPKRQVEIAPYLMSEYSKYEAEEGNPFADGSDFSFNAGIDGKIGITNDFILDFTINPDFGQVEADPSDVNLTAFETYFREKRPFFIENKNITSINLSPRREDIFYSRRLGRSPIYEPDYDSDEYMKMPSNTKILGALKFSGKSKDGWSIGIIETIANREYAKIINTDGDLRRESVEPLTNYFIARLQKDINKGNTMIGGIITSTYRDFKNEELTFMNKTATTGGIDFHQYFFNKKYSIAGKILASHITGTNDAMIYQQISSRRYFQRPNADYVELDSNLNSMTGTFANIEFSKNAIKGLRYSFSLTYRSPSFELNDIGYLRNSDNIMQVFWAGYGISETKGIFRELNVSFTQWSGFDGGLNYQFMGGNVGFNTQFINLWEFWSHFEYNHEGVSNDMLRGGSSIKYPASFSISSGINTNDTKKIVVELNGSINRSKFDYMNSSRIGLEFDFRPFNLLSLNFEAGYNKMEQKMQFVTNIDIDQQYYVMSSIDQNTVDFTFRFDLNITPDLTIQYYGAPFVSAARYFDYKNILNPLANNFDDRYYLYNSNQYNSDDNSFDFDEDGNVDAVINSDFNFQEFRSNLILRWEYIPGSVLFLVWAHEQSDYITTGEFNFSNDFSNLFKVTPADRFLIKFQYRFM